MPEKAKREKNGEVTLGRKKGTTSSFSTHTLWRMCQKQEWEKGKGGGEKSPSIGGSAYPNGRVPCTRRKKCWRPGEGHHYPFCRFIAKSTSHPAVYKAWELEKNGGPVAFQGEKKGGSWGQGGKGVAWGKKKKSIRLQPKKN